MYEALSHETVVGRTEIEVAWWLERTMREHGAEALAFDPIVASGLNGSRPHADPVDAAIDEGTLVTVDMGCVVDGYRSDCTRTFATGDLPSPLEEAYGLVAQAQLGRPRRGSRGCSRIGRRCRLTRRDRGGRPR